MSEEGQQLSVLRDRIEELLFRLRRDDERMNAQLSSGLAGIFTSNAMQREDVTKALEDMLRIDSEPPARRVRVTLRGSILGQPQVIEATPGDGLMYSLPSGAFGPLIQVEWAE